MGLFTINPTSNTTPDPAQGGNAVTGNTNTGHGSTTVTSSGAADVKTCLWTSFQSVSGQIKSITLKVGWSESGGVGAGGSSEFKVEYSLNGGSTWSVLFDHLDIISPDSGTAQVDLSATQDISQVRVRDNLTAIIDASFNGAVSDIRLEVVTRVRQPIVMQ